MNDHKFIFCIYILHVFLTSFSQVNESQNGTQAGVVIVPKVVDVEANVVGTVVTIGVDVEFEYLNNKDVSP
jgi:hypothetical protein